MSKIKEKPKRETAAERLATQVADLSERAKLDSWNSFVEELQVPADLYPAMVTQRPELLRLVTARAMTAEEVAVLFKLIAGLMETNAALREHTQQVAQLTDNWLSAFKGLASVGVQINDFANFRVVERHEADEEVA